MMNMSYLTYHPGLSNSDHCCLRFNIDCKAKKLSLTNRKRNFLKRNCNSIKLKMNKIQWKSILNSDTSTDYKSLQNI